MSQITQSPLRRSKRKLTSRKDFTVVDNQPPATKKVRKVSSKKTKKVSGEDSTKMELINPARATLMSLNYDVQDKLLQYLDVQVR